MKMEVDFLDVGAVYRIAFSLGAAMRTCKLPAGSIVKLNERVILAATEHRSLPYQPRFRRRQLTKPITLSASKPAELGSGTAAGVVKRTERINDSPSEPCVNVTKW